jgi:predicted dehydrogenase
MRVLIIGLGSIAQKHIIALRSVVDDVEIDALRSTPNPTIHPNITNVTNIDRDYDLVIISTPSSNHLDDIKKLLGTSTPIMVEKPFLINKEQIEEFKLLNLTNPIYIACNLRFIPSFNKFINDINNDKSKVNEVTSYCGSYLPDWRPNQDYTKSYSANSKLGGGVNLDLIHEFDLMYYMFGKPDEVIKRNRKVSTLKLDSYDYSHYILGYNDFDATVKLNYFRKDYKRYIEVVKESKTYYYEFNSEEFSISYAKQIEYVINNREYENNPTSAIEVLNIVL